VSGSDVNATQHKGIVNSVVFPYDSDFLTIDMWVVDRSPVGLLET
jgi:hypothetical protein